MKFRRSCNSCGVAFFSTDRKANYCPKCARSKPAKPSFGKQGFQSDRPNQNQVSTAPRMQPEPQQKKSPRPPKATELTPTMQEQIVELYKSLSADESLMLREINVKISNQLWVKVKLVNGVVHNFRRSTQSSLTEEQRTKVLEMYRQFVETLQRPEGGRRRNISNALGLSFSAVRKAIREMELSELEKSPTSLLRRNQLFAIEKLYLDELRKQEHSLAQIPDLIANQLGFTTCWQVLRWIDKLNEYDPKFNELADPSPEIQQQILKLYDDYLAATEPPHKGLHSTIAKQLEGVNRKQVHKVLSRYRQEARSNYPLP